jgi:hypothetical protein
VKSTWKSLVGLGWVGLGVAILGAGCQDPHVLADPNCSDRGRNYANGESYPDPDGCGWCSCAKGYVKCTSTVCQGRERASKVDLLLVLDNSRGMRDKLEGFAEVLPELVLDLISPECIDSLGKPTGERANAAAEPGEQCAVGKPRHAPVNDLHVGVVTTSMGGRGSSTCPSEATDPHDPTLNAHADDMGHLLGRLGPAQTIDPRLSPSNFLAWFPDVKANQSSVPSNGAQAIKAFEDVADLTGRMVRGVGGYGCEYEAPLESFYHFLVQPDPFDNIGKSGERAEYRGIDEHLLQQRADFLRPDSLVAVVVLSDEDDASVDPLSLGGKGWTFLEPSYPSSIAVPAAQRPADHGGGSTAPRGTSECDVDPGSLDCLSCGLSGDPRATADIACREGSGFRGPTEDDMSVRFHEMKRRYGVEPLYPIKRYVDGLTKTQIPDRITEHDVNGNYIGQGKCRNPVFAKNLPTTAESAVDPRLCNLEKGPRTSDMVFFEAIVGVPADLVPYDRPFLDEDQWVRVIGRDPDKYGLEGIDARMVSSVPPRSGRPVPSATFGDAEVGGQPRDWQTGGKDLQYACMFPLPELVSCLPGADDGCPCDGNTPSPACASPTVQARGKAYPGHRPLRVAHALREQGILASICPTETAKETRTVDGKPNPMWGYRPAVKRVVDRLSARLDAPLAAP